jgi:hypothetical protein
MEDLMELVAASLARHGIECPADNEVVKTWASSPIPADPTALPKHNFRNSQQGDPAP